MEKEKFNQIAYINEWKRKNVQRINLQLNKNTEKDIIDHLAAMPNRTEYIKELIRKDMNGKK